MKQKTLNEKNLKAFLVSFSIAGQEDLKNVAIVAYTKQEAGDIFAMWAHGKRLYAKVCGICVQRMKKNKRNAHMFTQDFYERQNAYVNDIFDKAQLN